MDLYSKVYNILDNKLIPNECSNKLLEINNKIISNRLKINKLTASYYIEENDKLFKLKEDIIDDISCYNFYSNNEKLNSYDLHGIYGNQVDSFLDAIFDYNSERNNSNFKIITGNGHVIKPKVIKYLRFYNVKYKVLEGIIEVII